MNSSADEKGLTQIARRQIEISPEADLDSSWISSAGTLAGRVSTANLRSPVLARNLSPLLAL